MKLEVKERKIWKTGGSYVVSIPKDYIINGMLKEGQEISFTIKEDEQGEQGGKNNNNNKS